MINIIYSFQNKMKNSEVCFITSFNKRLLKEYATKFLESYNLPFDLFIYSEDSDLDVSRYVKHIQSVKTECLFEDKEFLISLILFSVIFIIGKTLKHEMSCFLLFCFSRRFWFNYCQKLLHLSH